MAMYIQLNDFYADQVRGPSLRPVERVGHIHILPVAVLSDPLHEEHWEVLAQLPQVDSEDDLFPAPLEVPEDQPSPDP